MSNILTDWLKDTQPEPNLGVYIQGFEAYASGATMDENPYNQLDGRFIDWNNGFLEGEYRATEIVDR